jgi:hypothetical protein
MYYQVRQNSIEYILSLAMDEDLAVVRDSSFAIANLSDSLELQGDLVRDGVLRILSHTCKNDDARVQVLNNTQNCCFPPSIELSHLCVCLF